jgi:hypothetical protein
VQADASSALARLAAKAAAVGATPTGAQQHDDDGPAYLWPECVPAWTAFLDLQDQWTEAVLPRSEIVAHLQEVIPDPAQRRQVYEDVCACARSARQVVLADRAERQRQQQAKDEARAASRLNR